MPEDLSGSDHKLVPKSPKISPAQPAQKGHTAPWPAGWLGNSFFINLPTRTWELPPPTKFALFLDGINNVVVTEHSAPLSQSITDQLSVAFWIRPEPGAVQDETKILQKGIQGTTTYFMDLRTNINGIRTFLNFLDPSNSIFSWVTGSHAWTSNEWAHVVWVFSGAGTGNAGRFRWYINGLSRSADYVGTVPATLGSNTGSIDIGAGRDTSGNFIKFFSGTIDNFKMFTSSLTSQEVLDIYNGVEVNRGILLDYRFDEGTGSTTYSQVGGFSGNMSGASFTENVAPGSS